MFDSTTEVVGAQPGQAAPRSANAAPGSVQSLRAIAALLGSALGGVRRRYGATACLGRRVAPRGKPQPLWSDDCFARLVLMVSRIRGEGCPGAGAPANGAR